MRQIIITALLALITSMGSADARVYLVGTPDAESQLNGIIAAIQTELSSQYDKSYSD